MSEIVAAGRGGVLVGLADTQVRLALVIDEEEITAQVHLEPEEAQSLANALLAVSRSILVRRATQPRTGGTDEAV